MNVDINIKNISDESFIILTRKTLEPMEEGVSKIKEAVFEKVRRVLK